MKFGLSEGQFILLDELVIKPLKSRNASVYVFGSRARGNFHPFSDIDIVFVEDKQNLIDPSELSKIKEDIENSKVEVKVDLVRFEDLAKSYVASIDKDKILIE